jgi:predicted secreted protein
MQLKKFFQACALLLCIALFGGGRAALAAPGASVLSHGIEGAYGELPEVDGFNDVALQAAINKSFWETGDSLQAALRGQEGLNYSYRVLHNNPDILSLIIRVDGKAGFVAAKGVTVDLHTGALCGLGDLFKTTEGFFDTLEKNLGWRPAADAVFALSPAGLVFVRPADGVQQTIGYDKIFTWVLFGKAGYYIDAFRVTAAAEGKLLRVKTGNMVVLLLESNRSAGYSWQIKDTGYLPVLEYMGSSYQLSSNTIGAGGWDIVIFGVKTKGDVWLNMEYKRGWETQSVKEFKVEVLGE